MFSYSHAWREGYNAYLNGEHNRNNPYMDPEDAERMIEWDRGWQQAAEDD
tara:strand:- start:1245 stop:1394 length:150 start_codon:yes stop_codon:yes gene_type:complete